jgi:hypothetical protein
MLAAVSPLNAVEGLRERAHAEAMKGVHTSVIGASARVDSAGLRSIALAGQGRQSFIGTGARSAEATVSAELSAAGRVVARAVRLRVRLGAGVQLVSVLGSRRLDTRDADKVRAAEKAIDLKVAEATGIRADRGEDEDGIQIVIPAFMAGDDHVILFDVVVAGPGPVMDVRVRYKDLVTLGNGEAAASLSLPAGQVAVKADHTLVTRNLAARFVSDALTQAATGLRAKDFARARVALNRGRALVANLAAKHPGEASLAADLRLLEACLRIIAEPDWKSDGALVAKVASSMRLAARLELGAR